ncbi:MAG: RdgB/HAM1 family non-canonical purine NTP pyrophosphatase [Betaproteobacteria bacterium]|nr:RdgB/HAM1 family non-canonical purine NTP pyrophosphatase [Betaproteobacteria bacterium]
MKKIVIASNNVGKLNEIAAILAPLDIEIVAQSTLGVSEAAEPHCTFVENALAKARHASGHTKLPALADDSGICVDALNGAPGVYSARFAGESAGGGREQQDARNNKKLLELMARETNRKAHYYCVIVLVRRADDPQPIICEAEWHGEILQTPRGSGGFGYDPLFLLPQLKQTGAELKPAEKNRISHRAQALGMLAERLRAERRKERGERSKAR